jgi:hypothetical protein
LGFVGLWWEAIAELGAATVLMVMLLMIEQRTGS